MREHDTIEDVVLVGANAPAPFADRANGEPTILRGMNQSEVLLVAWVAFPAWAALGVLLGLFTHIWALAMLFGSVGPMLTVWMLAGWLASKKLNRPDGFYVHQFKAWKAKVFGKQLFITHRGYWSLGRALEVKSSPNKATKKATKKATNKPAKKTIKKTATTASNKSASNKGANQTPFATNARVVSRR